MDYGQEKTEKELAALEQRIGKIYREASDELKKTIEEYFAQFEERDKHQRALLDAGEITKDQYTQWRLNQIGRGKRFEDLRDKIAERYTNANEVAVAYVNDATPGIYSLNRNYAAYTIEQAVGDVGFTLWDEQTVKLLIVAEPGLMPYYPPDKAVKRGIDLDYGKKVITKQVTSGILLGESIGKIANRLQRDIPGMERASAVRTARTSVTGAQNAGRMDSYKQAVKMGIKVQKKWVATKDNRTRHSHAMLDGEIREIDEKFSNGCIFPGEGGPPREIYNCRCRIDYGSDFDLEAEPRMMRVRDPETGRNVLIKDMTYREWAEWKAAENKQEWDIYVKKGKNLSSDKKQWEEYKEILGNKIPGTFAGFQDLKYNDPETWGAIKTLKRQTVFVNNAECETTPKKFTQFFLKPGAKHSEDFFKVGYSKENPLQLRYDIASAFDMSKAIDRVVDKNGVETFNIYMNLGVNKKKRFLTGWQIDAPGKKPRIITGFRKDKGNDQ